MSIEEAITILSESPWYTVEISTALDVAVAALMKQIPIRPVGHQNMYNDTPDWTDHCPNCGMELNQAEDYCHFCGQKLKWGKP